MQTHAHAPTAHGPLCHIPNTSHQAPVYESNEKRPHCLRWRCAVGPDSHTECQLPGSGLASQRNRGENQINLSLLTVVGFDPIWELATHSILFVFTWRMHTEGQRLSERNVLFFKGDERKKERRKEKAEWSKQLSCLAPVQVRAVTQTVNSISPFIHGGLSGSLAQTDGELGEQRAEPRSEGKRNVGGGGGGKIISTQ